MIRPGIDTTSAPIAGARHYHSYYPCTTTTTLAVPSLHLWPCKVLALLLFLIDAAARLLLLLL